jgi:hypothetical protein
MAVEIEGDIPFHYKKMFRGNIEHALQNEGSILRPHATMGAGSGEGATVVDLFGATRGKLDTDRYGDTPHMDVARERIWAYPKTYEWGTLIDRKDNLKMMMDPASQLTQAAVWGLGQDLDELIIMPAFFGSKHTGVDGATPRAFGYGARVSPIVAVDVQDGSGTGDVGMNVKKLQTARKLFRQNKVKLARERITVAMCAQQEDELFDDVKAINGDYVAGRPLEKGVLPGLFDMNFVIIEDLPLDGDGHRRCPAWVPSGLHLLDWAALGTVDAAKSPGKKFNVQLYASFTSGASRGQEGKVVEIKCNEP